MSNLNKKQSDLYRFVLLIVLFQFLEHHYYTIYKWYTYYGLFFLKRISISHHKFSHNNIVALTRQTSTRRTTLQSVTRRLQLLYLTQASSALLKERLLIHLSVHWTIHELTLSWWTFFNSVSTGSLYCYHWASVKESNFFL